MKQAERRKSPRVVTDMPLRLTIGGRTVETRIHDLSSSGIRFGTPDKLPLLSRVQIALELPAGRDDKGATPIAIAGVVVRCDRAAGAGSKERADGGRPPKPQAPGTGAAPMAYDTAIFFESLPEGARALLSKFVTARLR